MEAMPTEGFLVSWLTSGTHVLTQKREEPSLLFVRRGKNAVAFEILFDLAMFSQVSAALVMLPSASYLPH